MIVVVASQVQCTVHHQMGEVVRRPAVLPLPPRARITPSASSISGAGAV